VFYAEDRIGEGGPFFLGVEVQVLGADQDTFRDGKLT
jgi:hypothetical protein